MDKPVVAQDSPYQTEVEEGKTYAWCACGKSATQPFCDGSHSGTDFSPVMYTAEKAGTVFFCGCKKTKNQPLCDGSHSAQ
ncbi:MAG: CDGSH iron-sulfur domain-containing protein [Rhodospirillales bacterium]|nr:CDGSH iron-sulfur domain-containing protein [Rhodospirillales bacterium]